MNTSGKKILNAAANTLGILGGVAVIGHQIHVIHQKEAAWQESHPAPAAPRPLATIYLPCPALPGGTAGGLCAASVTAETADALRRSGGATASAPEAGRTVTR
ncbi:MAG: hypothetical protein PW734_02075 [Verrucomicrobium sp.]|nr:hypothetical protein [Verrucomicrobium sp.]